jgi:hypothetical protein
MSLFLCGVVFYFNFISDFVEKARLELDVEENKLHCKCLLVAKRDVNIKKGPNYAKHYYSCPKQNCNFHIYEVWPRCFSLFYLFIVCFLISFA